MKLVEEVYEIAESFMKDSNYIDMDQTQIKKLSELMLETDNPIFPIPKENNLSKAIMLELVAASVNYCYWYGKHNIRPGGASSTRMYELLITSFYDYEHPNTKQLKKCIDRFSSLLINNRFPLIEERINHLNQLKDHAIGYCLLIEKWSSVDFKGSDNIFAFLFDELIEKFPGFASDIFLKRASLFFIQLYRRFGWFVNELKTLHVPADYQIPKMLEHFGCIVYDNSLKQSINEGQLIPKNSIQECEIRAATIMTIKRLCELTKWNVADVDSFIFLRRNIISNPFHLTITTDY